MRYTVKLQEYTSPNEEELRTRNLKQKDIWQFLVDKNIVERNDTMKFYNLAKYFNDFRDEYGYDPDIKTVYAEIGRIL